MDIQVSINEHRINTGSKFCWLSFSLSPSIPLFDFALPSPGQTGSLSGPGYLLLRSPGSVKVKSDLEHKPCLITYSGSILLSIPRATRLVGTLERRHRLALSVVQSLSLNGTVLQIHLAMGLLLPCQGVLHPVLIVTLGEVLTSVSATGLLAVSSSNSSLRSAILLVIILFVSRV